MAVVLITGANRGIGLALVKAYAGRRDKVIACIRATSDRYELDEAREGHAEMDRGHRDGRRRPRRDRPRAPPP